MWHKILLLTFMTMIPSWIFADTPYLDLVEKADKACADGKWIEAASLLQNAIDSEPANPGNVLLLSNLGMVRYNLGFDSLAIESFNRALSIAPSSVTILANRAKVYTAMGHEQEAFDDYGRIMQLDSTYITARYHHGLLALKHRMFDVAKTILTISPSIIRHLTKLFIAQATIHSSLGEYEQAIPFTPKYSVL